MAKGRTKKKRNKICPAGIAWAKKPLTPTLQLMQIWRPVNIVKILTTQKKVKDEKYKSTRVPLRSYV